MTVEPSGPVAQAAEVIVTISPLPAPDRQPAGRDGCVGRPADLQRSREPAGRSRRRSSSRCRARPCSSSTTGRPTAPASSPTTWRRATRGSGSGIGRRKQGLGKAYLDGFGVAIAGGAGIVIQMDADFQHDPAVLPGLVAPILADEADLVIGSRYVKGGGVATGGSSGGSSRAAAAVFARIVLGLKPHDLTGGFKAWRRDDAGRPCRSTACTPADTSSRSR